MSYRVRFALVGCGGVAKKHVTALDRIGNAEIVAVCDTDPSTAEEFGAEHGLPFYTDPRTMAKEEEFDVFSILTPSGTHAKVVLELLEHDRHFVVEKPLALRIADADDMIRGCNERGLKLYVVQQNRFNRPIQKLRQAIESGRFGKMVMGAVRVRWTRHQSYYDEKDWRGTWAQDGGVLTNQASHHIDMLAWMMGDVESVSAMTATRLVDIEAEDTGVANIRFTNGALGIIEATTATRPEDQEGSISIMGENGIVEIGGYYMNELKTWQFEDERPDDESVFEIHGSNPEEWAWNHTQYLRNVIESLQADNSGLVDGLEGRKSLELITAIYESTETREEVPLSFRPRRSRLGESP